MKNSTGLRTGKDSNVKITRALLHKVAAFSASPALLVLSLAAGQAQPCYAQTQPQPDAPAKVAAASQTPDASAGQTPAASNTAISLEILKELDAMKAVSYTHLSLPKGKDLLFCRPPQFQPRP